MALSKIGTGASDDAGGISSTSRTLTADTESVGDLVLLPVYYYEDTNNAVLNAPTGATFTDHGPATVFEGSGSNESLIEIFSRVIDGSEGASFGVSRSAQFYGTAQLLTLRGASALSVVSVNVGTPSAGAVNTINAPSVSVGATQGIVCVFALSDPSGGTYTGPSGMTLGISEASESTTVGRVYFESPSAGASGVRTLSWTGSARNAIGVTILVEGANASAGATGTGAVTLGALTVAGTAERTITGTGAVTLGAIAVAGSGAVSGEVSGTGAITLGPIEVSGTAERSITDVGGAVNLTLPAITVSGSGTASGADTITGTGAIALGAVTVSGTAERSIPGSGAITLGAIEVSGQALLSIDGTGAITLGALQVSGFDVAPASGKGAGRPKRKLRRKRLLVEIDGRDFEVESVEQAVALLERAKEVAVKQIAAVRASPVRVSQGIKRPSIRTNSEPLRELVREKRAQIVSLYDQLLRDLEIQHLMVKAEEDDEEETLIRLLM